MEREKRRDKNKSAENKKSHNKKSKHQMKGINIFFEVFFFCTETKTLRQKNKDFSIKTWKEKIAKCFFEDYAWKNKFMAKIVKLKKSNFSQRRFQRRSNDIFWNFCPKTKRQFFEVT